MPKKPLGSDLGRFAALLDDLLLYVFRPVSYVPHLTLFAAIRIDPCRGVSKPQTCSVRYCLLLGLVLLLPDASVDCLAFCDSALTTFA